MSLFFKAACFSIYIRTVWCLFWHLNDPVKNREINLKTHIFNICDIYVDRGEKAKWIKASEGAYGYSLYY